MFPSIARTIGRSREQTPLRADVGYEPTRRPSADLDIMKLRISPNKPVPKLRTPLPLPGGLSLTIDSSSDSDRASTEADSDVEITYVSPSVAARSPSLSLREVSPPPASRSLASPADDDDDDDDDDDAPREVDDAPREVPLETQPTYKEPSLPVSQVSQRLAAGLATRSAIANFLEGEDEIRLRANDRRRSFDVFSTPSSFDFTAASPADVIAEAHRVARMKPTGQGALAAMRTPYTATGQKRRAPRARVPKYGTDIPAIDFDDPLFRPPPGLAGSGLDAATQDTVMALLQTQGLTEKTIADYRKKVQLKWHPFVELSNCDPLWPSVGEVCGWIVWMNAAGTCSDQTIGVYFNARSKLQPDRDPDDVRRDNPFLDPACKTLRLAIKKRRTRIDDDDGAVLALVRAPLPQTHALAVVEFARNHIARIRERLNLRDGSASTVTYADVTLTRDCVCVLVSFALGFRAAHIWELLTEDLTWESENPAWKHLSRQDARADGNRVASLRVRARGSNSATAFETQNDGGRVMRDSPWMRDLGEVIQGWLSIRRWWCSLRMDLDALERGEIVLAENPSFVSDDAREWEARREALRPWEGKLRLLELFMQIPDPKTVPCAQVQKMMDSALRAAGCPPAPPGKKYTTHSMRAGGATTCWLVTRAMPIVRWWFRWADNSKTPEQCYIAFEWHQLNLQYNNAAWYFFGWLSELAFVTKDEHGNVVVQRGTA